MHGKLTREQQTLAAQLGEVRELLRSRDTQIVEITSKSRETIELLQREATRDRQQLFDEMKAQIDKLDDELDQCRGSRDRESEQHKRTVEGGLVDLIDFFVSYFLRNTHYCVSFNNRDFSFG